MKGIGATESILCWAVALTVTACGEEALVSYTFFEEEPDFSPDLLVVELVVWGGNSISNPVVF